MLKTFKNYLTRLIPLIAITFIVSCNGRQKDSKSESYIPIVLVSANQLSAIIVTAENPTPSARLAALEIQTMVKCITGVKLAITSDTVKISKKQSRIFVGESEATRKLGFKADDFQPQEYAIAFRPNTIILIGRDWLDTPENRAEAGRGTNWESSLAQTRQTINYASAVECNSPDAPATIELPGPFDDQASLYAAYDFLERFLGVRFYGPTPLNTITRQMTELVVMGSDIRRMPGFKYRDATGGNGGPILAKQWNDPTPDQITLYQRRLRLGGEKWGGNHSIRTYYDRFLKKNPEVPELWEGKHPEFFAKGRKGDSGGLQFCYSNKGLIKQMAKDACDYFDGKGIKGFQIAMGDYFTIVPNDNNAWCLCDKCQASLALDKDNHLGGHFNSGTASHYLFGFVNAVAKEVAKTHPDKKIATLAYPVYAWPPKDFKLEPNVSVAPCLQPRNYWAPRIRQAEMSWYKQWVEPRDRPIYLWNYYCFPTEAANMQGWHCFPGSSARHLAELIKMYYADSVRGVFLCGIGEQLDYYLTMKMYDDPTLNADAFIDEFFDLYFGATALQMKTFFDRTETIFWDTSRYPEAVAIKDDQFHQTEEMAWKYLGTTEVMTELRTLIEKAREMTTNDLERQRLATWDNGMWKYMVEGREMWLKKQGKGDETR